MKNKKMWFSGATISLLLSLLIMIMVSCSKNSGPLTPPPPTPPPTPTNDSISILVKTINLQENDSCYGIVSNGYGDVLIGGGDSQKNYFIIKNDIPNMFPIQTKEAILGMAIDKDNNVIAITLKNQNGYSYTGSIIVNRDVYSLDSLIGQTGKQIPSFIVYNKFKDSFILSGGNTDRVYEIVINPLRLIAESDTLYSNYVVIDNRAQVWSTARNGLGVYFLGTDLSQKKIISYSNNTSMRGWFTILNDTIYTSNWENIYIFSQFGKKIGEVDQNTLGFLPTFCMSGDEKSIWFSSPSDYYRGVNNATICRLQNAKYRGNYPIFPVTNSVWANEYICSDGTGNIWVNNPEQGSVTKVTPLYK